MYVFDVFYKQVFANSELIKAKFEILPDIPADRHSFEYALVSMKKMIPKKVGNKYILIYSKTMFFYKVKHIFLNVHGSYSKLFMYFFVLKRV